MEENLKDRLFNKKESGWKMVDDTEKKNIFDFSKRYR